GWAALCNGCLSRDTSFHRSPRELVASTPSPSTIDPFSAFTGGPLARTTDGADDQRLLRAGDRMSLRGFRRTLYALAPGSRKVRRFYTTQKLCECLISSALPKNLPLDRPLLLKGLP